MSGAWGGVMEKARKVSTRVSRRRRRVSAPRRADVAHALLSAFMGPGGPPNSMKTCGSGDRCGAATPGCRAETRLGALGRHGDFGRWVFEAAASRLASTRLVSTLFGPTTKSEAGRHVLAYLPLPASRLMEVE